MADLDYEGIWQQILIQLRNDLGEAEFSGWFTDTKYLRADADNSIIIGIPTAFHRDKVKSRYQNTLISKFEALSGKKINIEYEIIGKSENNDTSEPQVESNSTNIEVSKPKKRNKNPLLQENFTFDRYIIGQNNAFAANAAKAISKNPGKSYNPFLIYGGVGLGKTHLMQAIGNYIHDNSDNKVIFVTSEDFLNEYMEGLQQGKMSAFKNKFRYTDVLLIDDIQFLTDKPGVQEELFHTFNALAGAKKQLVFTCDRPPSELKKFSERLVSRFEQGIKADLQPPRYEERFAILKSTAESKNANISTEVLDFVSKNISSNVRDLVSALNTLIAYQELMKSPITMEIAQQRLKAAFSATRQDNLSVESIIRGVADAHNLTPNDLKGKKKTQNIVYARQLAMYIARQMTDYSTTELGQDFGGRDHTTVMHSIKMIKAKLLTDSNLENKIEKLIRSISESGVKF